MLVIQLKMTYLQEFTSLQISKIPNYSTSNCSREQIEVKLRVSKESDQSNMSHYKMDISPHVSGI